MSDSAVDGKGTSVTAVIDLPPNRVGRNTFESRTPVSALRTAPNERHTLTLCCGVRFAAGVSSRSAGSKKNCRGALFEFEQLSAHAAGANDICEAGRQPEATAKLIEYANLPENMELWRPSTAMADTIGLKPTLERIWRKYQRETADWPEELRVPRTAFCECLGELQRQAT